MPIQIKKNIDKSMYAEVCRCFVVGFHDIMQGILGKVGGLLNFLKPLVAVFAFGHRGRQLPCFSAFHGAHAFLCRSENSIEELACIGEVGLQCTFLILSDFQAQLDDKGRCARFHSS